MSGFYDALGRMFSADGFIPRRVCGMWPDWLVWEHVLGNAMVWMAYIAVPVMIWRLGVRRSELSPFRGVVRSFALFIGLCGLGHFLDMLAFFHPLYRLTGHVLVATGLVSGWTAWSLRKAWPSLLAMKSPIELERVIAERTAELRRSEEKFRLLAESIPQLAWMARADGHIFWYNRRWYAYTGTIPEQMEGWGWQSVHDPEVLPDVMERWVGSIASGEPFDMVFPLRGADGRFRRFLTRIVPSLDDDGRVLGWFGTNTDIDEQKRTEEAIQDSEERLRLANQGLERRVHERTAELGQRVRLIDQAHDAIMVRDKASVITSWNQGAEHLYGWTEEEAVGRISHELLGTRFPKPPAEIVAELERLGTWDGELEHVRRDGGRVVVATRWVLDRGGSDEGTILEINSDITERTAAEESLRRSEAALRESQRVAGVGSWEWDPAADVVTWSDELYRIAGRDPGLPPPRSAEHDELYTPESLALLQSVVARALETGEPYEVELEMIRGDGPHHWIIARGEAVRDPSGRVARLQGTSQDITERRAQREELRQAHDQAIAATEAKGDFLANMSHEIRTPMNGVVGMTDLLLDTQLNDLQRRYAETIRTSGEALITVINDILDFSKIEAGKLKIDAVDLDLRTVMEEVADLLAPRADQKGLEIGCRVAPDVPGRLVGDPVRIRQVLTNLVGNAVKFTDRGTVALEADLLADDGQVARLRIVVRDTGIGIPEDRQADIFESFTQVDGGSSRSYGGTGLGLAICQRLARLMGGRIGLESRPGFGSTFWFEVSLGRGQGEPDVSAEGLHGLRVLVVDDEETNRVILRETLLSWDCRPEVAASGVAALSRLLANDEDGAFGLILLDRMMPGMDGEQLARVIKAIPRHAGVPLVLLSSLDLPRGVEEFDPGLWAARLTKPIRRSQLYNILRRAVSSTDSLRTHPRDDGRVRLPSALNILLAEDNEVNRMVAIGLAERLGCVVESVCNGREAIEAVGRGRHDLILMDVQMPEMDGLDATAAIRERERGSDRHIPIIALTAHAMQGDRDRCLAAGMDSYLTKPLKLGPLREALLAWSLGGERATPAQGQLAETAFQSFSVEALREACGGEPTLIREVLGVMLRGLPQRLKRLEQAVEDRNGRQVSWEAHGLKGAFLTAGATTLAAACQELVMLGERGDFNAIESVHRPIRNQWELLAVEAASYLESLSALHHEPTS